MASSRSVTTVQQRGGGGGGASNEGAQPQHPHLQCRGNSDTGHSIGNGRHNVVVKGTGNRSTSFRSSVRTPVNKHSDHLITSSMMARGGGDDADAGLGDREPSSFALNAGSKSRRATPDMSKGHRYHVPYSTLWIHVCSNHRGDNNIKTECF